MDRVRIAGILKAGLLASLLASLLLITTVHGAEKTLVIKWGRWLRKGSSWFKDLDARNAEIMKKSENKVQFKIYPGGVLGDKTDMLRKNERSARSRGWP